MPPQKTWARTLTCAALFLMAGLTAGVGRELARPLVARALGISSTVYLFAVRYDTDASSLTMPQQIALQLAPVVFSALAAACGLAGWRLARSGSMRAFWLYLGADAAILTLTEIASMPFSGNLAFAPELFDLPGVLVWITAAAAAASLVALLWLVGARLRPAPGTILIPFAAYLALLPVIYAPVTWPMVLMMWAGLAPWIVAGASALWRDRRAPAVASSRIAEVHLRWSLRLTPVVVVLFVRLVAEGLRFGP